MKIKRTESYLIVMMKIINIRVIKATQTTGIIFSFSFCDDAMKKRCLFI